MTLNATGLNNEAYFFKDKYNLCIYYDLYYSGNKDIVAFHKALINTLNELNLTKRFAKIIENDDKTIKDFIESLGLPTGFEEVSLVELYIIKTTANDQKLSTFLKVFRRWLESYNYSGLVKISKAEITVYYTAGKLSILGNEDKYFTYKGDKILINSNRNNQTILINRLKELLNYYKPAGVKLNLMAIT